MLSTSESTAGQRWVSAWGNAVSVAENRPERYAKDVTLRYPIHMPFDGSALRLTFDNYCGTEPITIDKATVMYKGACHAVRFGDGGSGAVTIAAGGNALSDPIPLCVTACSAKGRWRQEAAHVSFYLKGFTLMRSVVYTCGPLSGGFFANGDQTETVELDINTSRATHLCYFLSNVSVLTSPLHRAIVCYGDSITSQDWPDYLALRLLSRGEGRRPAGSAVGVVRKATSGSRILREYTCLTYESYGLMGSKRLGHELSSSSSGGAPSTDGADAVIIQQGINDIIHPVGAAVNVFRPMSDLPTAEALIDGLKAYIAQARALGYARVYAGTLLPMGGWRTDAPFRQELRHAYNAFIRTTDLIDGCVDFDAALRDPAKPEWFLPAYDSGDHLHPSKAGYERMAMEVPDVLLQ